MVSFGPELSVLIGSGATLVAGLIVYFKRRRDTRTNLRIALEKELEGMQDKLSAFASLIDNSEAMDGEPIPEINFVTTVVYKNNTQQLGLLSDTEVNAVAEFYNDAIQLQEALDMIQEYDNPGETATYHAWFRENNIADLLDKNEKALEEIRSQQ
jgi:hypothetical protein